MTPNMDYETWLGWVDAYIQRWMTKTHEDMEFDWRGAYDRGMVPVSAASEGMRYERTAA
ncbi:hypothetical protein KIV64_gp17 [Mycobacterium phage DroogsArmy]|uniref:Uncharacterized protein n=2 Tax=Timshelvirus TaxID=2948926 RepID=G1DB94_9CAUD|nr:hypothetical protein FDI10_gp18 [Mycobacterium phage Timshel]YP_010062029.1 hypothetical protein KIV64_gp17 [Mycobacterium phage DroogsArmy]AEJ92358.1 hypothetical protein TIMSHEL_76 [Mycobacterium phage Timshel]QKO02471.1 hypothetical protein SEA_DROOGSARMY_75 [Mycobacterium phage DroogsArmy]